MGKTGCLIIERQFWMGLDGNYRSKKLTRKYEMRIRVFKDSITPIPRDSNTPILRHSVTPILRELHWLPVAERIHFKILLLTFKSLNDMVPFYLRELLSPYIPSRTLRSSSKSSLLIPRSRDIKSNVRFSNSVERKSND